MAFWGLKVEPGKWTPFVPPPDEALRLHISQVSRLAARLRSTAKISPPTAADFVPGQIRTNPMPGAD